MKKVFNFLLIMLVIIGFCNSPASALFWFKDKKDPKAIIKTVWNYKGRQSIHAFGDVEYSVYCTESMMCYAKVEGLERYDLTTIRALLNEAQNYFKITLVMKGKNSTDKEYYQSYYLPIQYGRGADRYWYVFSIMQIPSMRKNINDIVDVRLKEVNLKKEL